VRSFKILDQHYKILFSTDHRAKFHVGRPTRLGDLALTKNKKKTSGLKHKFFQKLSFSGRLTKNYRYLYRFQRYLRSNSKIVV